MWSAAEAEARAADLPVTVPLCDTTVDMPPLWQWPRDGLAALLSDEVETWAQLCLPGAEYQRWYDTDPTIDDCDEAVTAWEQGSGQAVDTIGRLWHILDRWPDELESDLVSYCNGQDLRHLWQPGHGPSRLTYRRLGVLYDGLPGQSLTKTAQANDLGEERLAELAAQNRNGHGPWSHTDMLLAAVVDAVNANTYVLRLANTDEKGRGKVKPAAPYPRPGVAGKRNASRPGLSDEGRKYLEYLRANQGAMPPGYRMVAK